MKASLAELCQAQLADQWLASLCLLSSTVLIANEHKLVLVSGRVSFSPQIHERCSQEFMRNMSHIIELFDRYSVYSTITVLLLRYFCYLTKMLHYSMVKQTVYPQNLTGNPADSTPVHRKQRKKRRSEFQVPEYEASNPPPSLLP